MKTNFRRTDECENYFSDHSNDPFQELTKHFFEKHQHELVFALIEVSAQDHWDGIGNISVFSSEDKLRLVKEYGLIIKKVQQKFGNFTQDDKWYGAALGRSLIFDHEDTTITYKNNSYIHPGWYHCTPPKEIQEESVPLKDITNESILEYLNYYQSLMHNEFGLKEFPYYFILIKPIAYATSKKLYRLGNLYIHIATKEKIKEEDIKLYSLYFQIAFNRHKGGDVIHKLLNNGKDQVSSKHEELELPDYLPNFKKCRSHKLMKPGGKYRQIYDRLFRDGAEDELEMVQQNEDFIIETLLLPLLKSQYPSSFSEMSESEKRNLNSFISNYETVTFEKSSSNLHFIKYLYKRKVFLIYVFLLKFDLDYINKAMGINVTKLDTIINYWYKDLLIPYACANDYSPSKKGINTTRENIYKTLSKIEHTFLKNVKTKVLEITDQLREKESFLTLLNEESYKEI